MLLDNLPLYKDNDVAVGVLATGYEVTWSPCGLGEVLRVSRVTEELVLGPCDGGHLGAGAVIEWWGSKDW